MKKIGLTGGIGPASTVAYYLGLIETCRKELGENEYPEIVIDSVNLYAATEYIARGEYEKSAELMVRSVSDLAAAGAKVAAITANTEHIVWDKMKDRFPIPVISIVEAVANEIQARGYQRVLVLGTVFTMKSGLYEKSLTEKGIVPILPCDADKEVIGDLIYPNLENGIVILSDKEKMLSIVRRYMEDQKADAVLLGCTELPLMIGEADVSVPVLDSTKIHIQAIFDAAK